VNPFFDLQRRIDRLEDANRLILSRLEDIDHNLRELLFDNDTLDRARRPFGDGWRPKLERRGRR
jgi:hypothetical protein